MTAGTSLGGGGGIVPAPASGAASRAKPPLVGGGRRRGVGPPDHRVEGVVQERHGGRRPAVAQGDRDSGLGEGARAVVVGDGADAREQARRIGAQRVAGGGTVHRRLTEDVVPVGQDRAPHVRLARVAGDGGVGDRAVAPAPDEDGVALVGLPAVAVTVAALAARAGHGHVGDGEVPASRRDRTPSLAIVSSAVVTTRSPSGAAGTKAALTSPSSVSPASSVTV